MAWNKPNCNVCKKPINTPEEAIVNLGGNPFGHPFVHYVCLSKYLHEYAQDVTGNRGPIAAGAFAAGGTRSGATSIATFNDAEEILSMNPKDIKYRAQAQRRLDKGYFAVFMFATGFDLITLSMALYFNNLKFDWLGWIAAGIWVVLSLIFTWLAIAYPLFSSYLSAELNRQKPKKKEFDLKLFMSGMYIETLVGCMIIGFMLMALLPPWLISDDMRYPLWFVVIVLSIPIALIRAYHN